MNDREGQFFASEEYDGYLIPQSDPDTPDEEKNRIISEAEAELKDLIAKIIKAQTEK